MSDRPVTWYEKLGKTIAMIHASSDYQQYIKRKQRRAFMDEFRPTGVGRHSTKIKMKNGKICSTCGDFFTQGRKMELCRICLGAAAISHYRGGLSTDQISMKLKCSEVTILNYLRRGTINKNPTLSLDEMMSVGTKPDRTAYEIVR